MLFKNTEGVYVEILRSHYTTDTAYYKSIMTIKGYAKVNKMNINEMNINEMNINEININEININEININEMNRIRSLVKKHP